LEGTRTSGNSAVAAGHEGAAWRAELRLRALERLHQKPARPPRVLRIGALVLLLVLHGAVLVALRDAMFAPRPADLPVVQVELVEFPVEPALPEPAARQSVVAKSFRPTVERHLPQPRFAPSPQPDLAQPQLFNPDGSIILPRETQQPSDSMTASFSGPPMSPDARIMHHLRPLKVRPNHFEANYRAASDPVSEFIADRLTMHQEFVLPWGTHVACAEVLVPVAVLGGCGWFTPYPYYVPVERWKPASVLDEE
jgi:hypothetical protein